MIFAVGGLVLVGVIRVVNLAFSLTCKACVEAVPLFAGHAERLRADGGTSL
ncbi:hypothetical protein B7755_045180 [Streptomyces sp. NBS 14/10]|uniref:hypothetical protein n=1 Tax=Streptomyces sp. NBS 14/10 TaxID=1945643 RepID=UPI0015C5A28F|nr:hypothetical protein [Streptomyces sp. NBS 14/10]KAK1184648.1 hypothetical protein B7755_045180 [Streptomyces sp. NBS 14/10]NUS85699.1 hypothetical protein [Streptomyces sp.]